MMRRSLLPSLALVPLLAVGGCGGGDDDPSAGPTTAAPSGAARVKVSVALPDGFPQDAIPLLDTPVSAVSSGEQGSGYLWSVVMQPEGDAKDVVTRAGDLLSDAGFDAGSKSDAGRLQVRQYADDDYTVGLTAVTTEDGSSLTYVIAKK